MNQLTRALSVSLIAFFSASAAPSQTAEDVVAKAIAARGGLTKIKAVQSQRVTGRITFAPGVDGPFVVELQRPHKMHMEISIGDQKLIRSFDGKSGGWVVNPFGQDKGAVPMSAQDIKSIDDESDFDGPLVDYQSKGNKIELVGKETFDDKPVFRLKLVTKDGDTRFYLLDANSYLLVKWEGTRKAGDKELPWESFFFDYREVDGLKYAFEIDSSSPDSETRQKLLAEKIELNPKIDEAHFAKPVVVSPPVPASAPATDQPPATPDPAQAPPQ